MTEAPELKTPAEMAEYYKMPEWMRGVHLGLEKLGWSLHWLDSKPQGDLRKESLTLEEGVESALTTFLCGERMTVDCSSGVGTTPYCMVEFLLRLAVEYLEQLIAERWREEFPERPLELAVGLGLDVSFSRLGEMLSPSLSPEGDSLAQQNPERGPLEPSSCVPGSTEFPSERQRGTHGPPTSAFLSWLERHGLKHYGQCGLVEDRLLQAVRSAQGVHLLEDPSSKLWDRLFPPGEGFDEQFPYPAAFSKAGGGLMGSQGEVSGLSESGMSAEVTVNLKRQGLGQWVPTVYAGGKPVVSGLKRSLAEAVELSRQLFRRGVLPREVVLDLDDAMIEKYLLVELHLEQVLAALLDLEKGQAAEGDVHLIRPSFQVSLQVSYGYAGMSEPEGRAA